MLRESDGKCPNFPSEGRLSLRGKTFSLEISLPFPLECPLIGAKKSTQTLFVQSFSKTLRVMDVRAKNRGRPHPKGRFSAAPVMGRNFLTQGRPGVRVGNVRGKSGPKSLCLCCFFFPDLTPQNGRFEKTKKKDFLRLEGNCWLPPRGKNFAQTIFCPKIAEFQMPL